MNTSSQPSGELFGAYYYDHNCGMPYSRSESWMNFFDQIAAHLVTDFAPNTVLDAGCAWGLLVERLRARGVEAYGIDISEYAIQNVHPDIQKYCQVGSITDPFPRRYDLIISIEVLEHMQPQDSERAIANLCQYSDNIIFSSTPFDYKEATHLNVQPPDYWARQFARHQFFRDLDYDATSYLTPWAARFYRMQTPSVQPVVQAYERKLLQLQLEVKDLRTSVIDYHQKLQAGVQDDRLVEEQRRELESLKQRLQEREQHWAEVEQTRGWRILKSIQAFRVRLFPAGSRRERILDGLFPRKTKP